MCIISLFSKNAFWELIFWYVWDLASYLNDWMFVFNYFTFFQKFLYTVKSHSFRAFQKLCKTYTKIIFYLWNYVCLCTRHSLYEYCRFAFKNPENDDFRFGSDVTDSCDFICPRRHLLSTSICTIYIFSNSFINYTFIHTIFDDKKKKAITMSLVYKAIHVLF